MKWTTIYVSSRCRAWRILGDDWAHILYIGCTQKGDNEGNTIFGNTDLTPSCQRQPRRVADSSTKYKLTSSQRQKLVKVELSDFSDVINLHCAKRGCQQCRIVLYLANGKMMDIPPGVISCGNACGMCTGEWHTLFLPVCKNAVIEWMESKVVRDALPKKANIDHLMDLLWKINHWTTAIFDRAAPGVCKYRPEGFFLQLIALDMLAVVKQNGELQWTLIHEQLNLYVNSLCYQNDKDWTHMNLLSPSRKIKFRIPTLVGNNG